MGLISPYFVNAVLGWFRGTNMPNAPTNIYVGLYNGDPLGGGSATEQTTNIRAAGRPIVGFGAPLNNVISNAAKIDFGKSVNNTTVTHAALCDAQSGGNILISQQLDNPRTIYTNDPLYYEQGELKFSMTST